MDKDLWEEICFILTETIPSNVSEQIYENKVIRVFEKLGWSQYKKNCPFGNLFNLAQEDACVRI